MNFLRPFGTFLYVAFFVVFCLIVAPFAFVWAVFEIFFVDPFRAPEPVPWRSYGDGR